jgi:hypothetical protein
VRRALPLLLFLALAGPAYATIEVQARLEPEVLGLGETATFTVQIEGTGFGRMGFRPPEFDLENFEIVGGPYQQEDIRFANGRLTRTFKISWRLRPLTTGTARVNAIAVRVRGATVQIGDREVEVQEEPTGRGSGDAPGEDPLDRFLDRMPWQRRPEPNTPGVFLRADVTPQQPFVGEQVLYTVHLYTRQDILAANAREVPTFRGFWVRDVPQPQSLPTELVDIGGERYGRVVLLQKALFPLRPGEHAIEPSAMDLVVRTFERRFFGPPLSRHEELSLRTPPRTVNVRPLPAAPARFGGAVGQLSLAARLEPAEIRLGEAATLTVTLAGAGNLQGVEAPQVTAPAGLDLLPPQQAGDEELQGTRVHGSRTWSFPVVPRRPGRHTLEVPPVSYFDPRSGQYRTAAASPVAFTALPRTPLPGGGELHGVRGAAFAAQQGADRWSSLVPWLFALPWALALVLTLARKRASAGRPAPPRSDVRNGGAAWRRTEQRLAEIAAETRPRQAAARIEEAWREFLEERWEIPAATASARWGDLLAERGAEPEAARELAGLIGDLHYLRYAPQLCSIDALRDEALDRSRRLLRRLR